MREHGVGVERVAERRARVDEAREEDIVAVKACRDQKAVELVDVSQRSPFLSEE